MEKQDLAKNLMSLDEIRRSAKFHPSTWRDYFIAYDSENTVTQHLCINMFLIINSNVLYMQYVTCSEEVLLRIRNILYVGTRNLAL